MAASLKRRRRALEELRLADRIAGAAIGRLQMMRRQQAFDLVGMDNDGLFGEHDRADVSSAQTQLIEAEQAFRTAMRMIGGAEDGASVDLERWGLAEGVFDGIFDVLALFRASRNLERARELHRHFVRVFEAIRGSDPKLSRVEPLADWDEDLRESIGVELAYNRPFALALGGRMLLIVGAGAFFLLGVVAWAVDALTGTEQEETAGAPLQYPVAVPADLRPVDIPAALRCEEGPCISECTKVDAACKAYRADLDADGTEEWILAATAATSDGDSDVLIEIVREDAVVARMDIHGMLVGWLRLGDERGVQGWQTICGTVDAVDDGEPMGLPRNVCWRCENEDWVAFDPT